MVSSKEKADTLVINFARAHNNILPSDPRTVEDVNRTMEDLANSTEINIDPSTLTKPSEIKEIIKRLKSKKSPGQDGIRNVLLKNLPRKGLVYLTKVFNGCIKLMHFPSIWKHATVVGIPKPKQVVTLPTNYRPISLLNSLSKVLERIILNRLKRHLSTNAVIPKEQFGFRAGHSTNHQLTRITRVVKQGFATKKSTNYGGVTVHCTW